MGAGAPHGRPPIGLPKPRISKERLRLRSYATILLLDLACIAGAFLLANQLWLGDVFAAPGLRCIALAATLFAILAFTGKAYSVEVLESPLTSAARGLRALALAGAALLVVFFTLKASAQTSRAVLGLGFTLGLGLVGVSRYLYGKALGDRHGWSFIREVLVLDGFAVMPKRGQIVVVAERSGISPFSNDPQAHDRLGRFLAHCDRVILACERSKRIVWGEALKGAGVPVEVLTPELDDLGALSLRHSAGQSCVLIAPGPMALRDRLLKRALDLAIAVPRHVQVLAIDADEYSLPKRSRRSARARLGFSNLPPA